MDFGLTQEAAGGGFGGTLPYMAPELLAGQPASVASDIYALGAMLFELVTGKCPVEPAAGVTCANAPVAIITAPMKQAAALRILISCKASFCCAIVGGRPSVCLRHG